MFTSLSRISLRKFPSRCWIVSALCALVVGLLTLNSGCSTVGPRKGGYFHFSGTVVDKSSLAPIDSARIRTWQSGEQEDVRHADTAGAFSFSFLTDSPTMKNLRVEVSKDGYVPFDTLMLEVHEGIEGWQIRLQKVQVSEVEVRDKEDESAVSEHRSDPAVARCISSSKSRVALREDGRRQLARVE